MAACELERPATSGNGALMETLSGMEIVAERLGALNRAVADGLDDIATRPGTHSAGIANDCLTLTGITADLVHELGRLIGEAAPLSAGHHPPRTATLATAWAAALDKWKEANKALHAWPGPDDIPAAIDGAETEAWRAMLATPAPDLAALGVKLRELLKIEQSIDSSTGWNGAEVRPVLADIDRLIPHAPEQLA